MATDLKKKLMDLAMSGGDGHATREDLDMFSREDLIERAMLLQGNMELLCLGVVAMHAVEHGCVLCSMLEENPQLAAMIAARALAGMELKKQLEEEFPDGFPEEEA